MLRWSVILLLLVVYTFNSIPALGPDSMKQLEEEVRASGYAVVKDIAELNEIDVTTGLTPLMYAAIHGEREKVKSFLVAGARVDVVNSKGDTALIMAVQHGQYHVVEELLKAPSSNLYQRNGLGANVLHVAIAKGMDVMVHAILYHDLNRRSNSAEEHGNESTPLVDTPLQGSSKMTGLMMACQMGKTDIVKTIIGVGANLNLQAPSGETALMYASLIGHARIVKLLLRSGARLDLATIDSGFNALMIASSRGHADVVEILLGHVKKNRLDIALDMIDVAGNTALDHAANATPPEEEIAQMLVVAGITLGRRGAIFATPSILAAREKAMAERDARSS